jgi:hypothetical protein
LYHESLPFAQQYKDEVEYDLDGHEEMELKESQVAPTV